MGKTKISNNCLQAYLDAHFNYNQIAKTCGISRQAVQAKSVKYYMPGDPIKKKFTYIKGGEHARKYASIAFLASLGYSIPEIAKELKYKTNEQIYKILKKFNSRHVKTKRAKRSTIKHKHIKKIKKLIEKRYKHREIAEKFGVTASRISQIIKTYNLNEKRK